MRIIKVNSSYFLAALVLSLITVNPVNATDLDSKWSGDEVTIDGMLTDWQGKLLSFDEDNVNFGVMNDGSYLYICIAPLDQFIIRQAVGAGMIVWIESKSKDKFGIRYPLGVPLDEIQPGEMRDRNNPEARTQHIEKSLSEIEIIDKDKKPIARVPLTNLMGISAAVETRNERLIYELKLPLQSSPDFPYAIEAKDGEKIKIEIETLKFDRGAIKDKIKDARSRRGDDGGISGPPGGGGPGDGMGRRGGGMRGGRGERPDMPEPLKLKLKVKLAESNNNDKENK